ncbi:thioredoxin [Putridiphycobacter roseus]|uniref:Thioredoxin n=1 Tax=Putridiphycobacter roseus TaxID=2219161 RepID=A0A2W1MUX6_9FLAO|nr:thioredoxin family protein [Putridiphycobacter roseus]PZE15869.1 thioredoxin [Putridiphycobacter roseus]
MIHSRLLILFLLLFFKQGYAQSDSLHTFSFENVDSLNAVKSKNVLVFFHTDWCKYCQLMNETTFKDKAVIELLNDNFYFVPFDPESETDIEFAGRKFKYIPNGKETGMHEIAIALAKIDGKINYPSICMLNQNYEIVFQYNQFLSAPDLIKVLGEVLAKK